MLPFFECDHDRPSIEEKISRKRDGSRIKDCNSDSNINKITISSSSRVLRIRNPVSLFGKESKRSRQREVDDVDNSNNANPMSAITISDFFNISSIRILS